MEKKRRSERSSSAANAAATTPQNEEFTLINTFIPDLTVFELKRWLKRYRVECGGKTAKSDLVTLVQQLVTRLREQQLMHRVAAVDSLGSSSSSSASQRSSTAGPPSVFCRILGLPSGVIIDISQCLQFDEVAKLSHACKALGALCSLNLDRGTQPSPALAKRRTLILDTNIEQRVKTNSMTRLVYAIQAPRSLVIYRFFSDSVNRAIGNLLQTRCQNLLHLHLDCIDSSRLQLTFAHCKNLRDLHLGGYFSKNPTTGLRQREMPPLPPLPRLESFKVDSGLPEQAVIGILSACTNITTLDVNGLPAKWDVVFWRSFTKLESLNLWQKGANLDQIAELPALRHLRCAGLWFDENTPIQLAKLERLELTRLEVMVINPLQLVDPHVDLRMPALKHLTIGPDESFHSNGHAEIMILSKAAPQLVSVSIQSEDEWVDDFGFNGKSSVANVVCDVIFMFPDLELLRLPRQLVEHAEKEAKKSREEYKKWEKSIQLPEKVRPDLRVEAIDDQ